jgi:hypothetical protein
VQPGEVGVGAERARRVDVPPVGVIVDEGAEVHPVARGEVAQHVVRTHLVALVRRKGDPVREVEQGFHRTPTSRDCAR